MEHDWFTPDFIGYVCCRNCGIVRRADGKNRPCRGPVTIGPRTKPGTGWSCPKCGRAHGPQVETCPERPSLAERIKRGGGVFNG